MLKDLCSAKQLDITVNYENSVAQESHMGPRQSQGKLILECANATDQVRYMKLEPRWGYQEDIKVAEQGRF